MFPPPPAVWQDTDLKMDIIETLNDGREVSDSVVDLFLM